MGIPNKNPYVGPRPFEEEEWELFFGRKREADDLLSLMLTSRLVLFYAPSGAGKSSLIRTSLCRGLRAEDFEVLPITRVSGELLSDTTTIDNIFVFNLLMHLDCDQHPPAQLAVTSLSDYVKQLRPLTSAPDETEPSPLVLMIDQFEEIFTAHPEAWDKREDFFKQLNQAMNECKSLWVLLALREEYVAALDPYARLLPGGLRTRFYMQSLSHVAALEALEGPAQKGNRPFEPGVAKILVDNLCLTWMRDHIARQYPGEFVEPVQLQVVCHQLWNELQNTPRPSISLADLQGVAGTADLAHFVDTALARFYADGIRRTMTATGEPELDLRDWFDDQMITEAGTRNLVFRGAEKTGGLSNHAVDQLAANLLIRGEARAAGTWYELIHDRLIQPIRDANLAWYQEHPLILLAYEWDKAGRMGDKLLEGQQLQTALASDWRGFGKLVSEFLNVSQAAQVTRDRELQETQRQQKLAHVQALAQEQQKRAEEAEARQRMQKRAIVLVTLLLLAAIGLGVWARVNALTAQNEATKAIQAQATAQAEATRAAEAEQFAEIGFVRLLASEAQQTTTTKPQLSLLLALQAVVISPQVNGRPVVTETLLALQQTLATTASYPLRGFDKHIITDVVRIVASPNGEWLAAGSQSGMVHFWMLTAGEAEFAQASHRAHAGAVTALAFSPDGRWLSTGGTDAGVNLFDMQALDAKPLQVSQGQTNGPVMELAFAPTGYPTKTWLAVGQADGVVQRIDLSASGLPMVSDLLGEQSRATASLAFSPDGEWLATVSVTDTLRIWPLSETFPITGSRPLSESISGLMTFSADGRWLATGSKQGTNVYLFDLDQSNGRPLTLPGHIEGVQALAFSPDHQLLSVGSGDGVVRGWELNKLEELLAVPTSQRKSAPPRPVPSKELLEHNGAVLALAFQVGEGNRITLATGSADYTVKLWDKSDLQKSTGTLYGHETAVSSLVFGVKPNQIFASSSDGTIRVWSLDRQTAPKDLGQLISALSNWEMEACRRAGRDFTQAEQAKYFGNTTVVTSTCAKLTRTSP